MRARCAGVEPELPTADRRAHAALHNIRTQLDRTKRSHCFREPEQRPEGEQQRVVSHFGSRRCLDFAVFPFQSMVAMLGAWLQREQEDVVAFLREENRVVRAQLGRVAPTSR